MVHGEDDEIVPCKMMESTKSVLENNLEVKTNLIKNLGHGINEEGLEIGQNFLVKYLLKC